MSEYTALDVEYLKHLADVLEELERMYGKKFRVDAMILNDKPDTLLVMDEHEGLIGHIIGMNSNPHFMPTPS
jgi:hypothetical protein